MSCFTTLSQSEFSVKLKGKVVNSKTGEIVPFCSVVINNTFEGTSSNEEGEFVIKLNKLPSTLIFSHVSFETTKITVSENQELLIKMTPLLNILEEVYIETKTKPITKDAYATNLAKKAFEKLQRQIRNFKYGKALYRQKSKNGSVYSELAEIIFDTRYSLNGVENWEIIEGRYALKKETINNKNFTLFTRIIKSLQPDTEDLIFPLSQSIESFYNVILIKTIKSENGDIAQLRFSPKGNQYPIFKSDVYIHKKNHDVLKIVSSVDDDRLDLVKFKENNIEKKNYHLDYEMVFKENESLGMVLDYININQEFDYFKDGLFRNKVSAQSNFTLFEYYPSNEKRRLGRQFDRSKSDWEKLNEIGYNQEFWEENPIIKRTPIEDDIIDQFERDNAFESIYINSRNQITFNQKDLLNAPFIKSLSAEIKAYNIGNPIEKVYLHTDKGVYYSGENIWFSAYAMMSENSEKALSSSMLHIDVLDASNKLILTQKNKLSDGRGVGNVTLPGDLPSGIYKLRVYTPWMKNYDSDYFFDRTIKVLSNIADKNIDELENNLTSVSFFPEGGDLVAGLNSKVAFKAIGNDGLGKKIKGKIIDSKKEHVINFSSVYNGIGHFSFTPKSSEKYTAVLDDNTHFLLPDVKNSGYVMSVNNLSERSVMVKIFADKQLRNKPVYVIGQIENRKYYQGKFEFGGNDFVEAEISKSRLPSGVLTITVLDEERVPFCERVVFVNNMDELNIATKINKSKLAPREKITLDILVTDPNGQPAIADVSLSVTDKNVAKKNENASNIYTSFLMESDLKGHIEKPYELLKDNNRTTKHKLDLVMLANGWRKFKIDRNNALTTKEFSISEGIVFRGWVKDSHNNQLKNTDVEVVAKSKDKIRMYSAKTDDNGLLVVADINQTGDVDLVFNVLDENRNVLETAKVIPFDDYGLIPESNPNIDIASNKNSVNNNSSFIVKTNKIVELTQQDKKYIPNLDSDIFFAPDSTRVKLDEVIVESKLRRKKEIEQATPSNYGVEPDKTIYTENRHEQRIQDLLMGVAGVTVVGNELSIRNAGAPLYIIDGIPVVNEDTDIDVSNPAPSGTSSPSGSENAEPTRGLMMSRSTSIPPRVLNLTVYDIERIEVLKGPSAAIYGVRGANGVILFYSKVGRVRGKDRIELPSHTINGYSVTKEFYSPKYNVKKTTRKKDTRSTLFWKPSIITDSNGRAKVEFFNSDNANEIQVNIEGLSIYGYPGSYLKTYPIEE